MNAHFMIIVLNCILIQHNIRQGYLIQNNDIIESTLSTISKTHSSLNQHYTNYGVIITKNKLNDDYDNEDDPTHHYKLGKLLGYPTVDQYPISKKKKELGYYVYHVKVELIKKTRITLFSFIAKDLSVEDKIIDLLLNIQDILYHCIYAIYIKKIYIQRIKKILIDKQSEKIIEVKFF